MPDEMTAQDVADTLNELGIGKAQFRNMLMLFVAQVNVAAARAGVAIASAQQQQIETNARETVAQAQNALVAAEAELAALVAHSAG